MNIKINNCKKINNLLKINNFNNIYEILEIWNKIKNDKKLENIFILKFYNTTTIQNLLLNYKKNIFKIIKEDYVIKNEFLNKKIDLNIFKGIEIFGIDFENNISYIFYLDKIKDTENIIKKFILTISLYLIENFSNKFFNIILDFKNINFNFNYLKLFIKLTNRHCGNYLNKIFIYNFEFREIMENSEFVEKMKNKEKYKNSIIILNNNYKEIIINFIQLISIK